MSFAIIQDPLLTTKLYIPSPRPNLVRRPHLTTRLNVALERKLTLISAPAGFGKTTLLAEWIYDLRFTIYDVVPSGYLRWQQQEIVNRKSKIVNRVAWLSLDEGDNDPARFLSYLVAALQTIQPEMGRAVLATLQQQPPPPTQENWAEGLLATLINEVTALSFPFALILDDVHLLNTPAMHHLLFFLSEHLPPQMHLVLAGRSEPPLPLARLRVGGQLLELRTTDLRFTPDEAATFLNQVMALNLSAADIATLETRTEGWIAGLQLAALSMQDRQDVSGFIASFSGSHRYVLDYLAEEVLNRQPQVIQQFLLQTSILNRMTGPLCEALTQFTIYDFGFTIGNVDTPSNQADKIVNPKSKIQNGKEMLTSLEQANLFIIPLDDKRRWYRYHHLFADFLRTRLEQVAAPGELTTLHRRAAAWYEQNGLPAEATGHALAMADVERAARLIEQQGRSVLNRGEMATLLSWLEALPAELVQVRPRLSLFHVWALVLTGQLEAVEARVQDAERILEESDRAPDIPGELTAIRATLAYFRRDLPQAITLFQQALASLPEENLFLRGAVTMSLATAYNLKGDLAGAKQAFSQATTLYETSDNSHILLIAHLNLAHLHVDQGQLHRAAENYQRALHFVDQQIKQSTVSYAAGRIYAGLATLLYQWNDLTTAARHLAAGQKLGEQKGDVITLLSCTVAEAWLKQAQGAIAEAFAHLAQAEQMSQQHNLPGWQIHLAVCQVQLRLRQGDVDEAARWVQRGQRYLERRGSDDSAGYQEMLVEMVHLAELRVWIAQNRPAEALARLTSLRQAAERRARQGRVIEMMLLQALAYKAKNNTTQAITLLEEALLLAEPEGYLRLFLDEGEPVAELLRQVRSRGLGGGYLDNLLTAFRAAEKQRPSPPPLIEPLSERELEILQLIEDGLSNQQISEKLFLTVGTVKWHVNNIYGKLNVRRRTQAVARARELGVL